MSGRGRLGCSQTRMVQHKCVKDFTTWAQGHCKTVVSQQGSFRNVRILFFFSTASEFLGLRLHHVSSTPKCPNLSITLMRDSLYLNNFV